MRVQIHHANIAKMFTPTGSIGRATARASGRVRDRAKNNAPVRDGLLKNSIISERVPGGSPYQIVYRTGTNVEYAIWQELGTRPIFARRAPLLTFKIGNKWVSTYSTKGVPASRYLTKAIEATTSADFRPGR